MLLTENLQDVLGFLVKHADKINFQNKNFINDLPTNALRNELGRAIITNHAAMLKEGKYKTFTEAFAKDSYLNDFRRKGVIAPYLPTPIGTVFDEYITNAAIASKKSATTVPIASPELTPASIPAGAGSRTAFLTPAIPTSPLAKRLNAAR
jgi:hypothetical protein